MEPMTLGSPTSSPSGSPNVGYLPPFLLGESNVPTTPRTNSLSPTKRGLGFGSATSPSNTSTPDQKLYRQNVSKHQQALYNQSMYVNSPNNLNMSYNNKSNGPPIEDLFDTIKKVDTFNNSTYQDNSLLGYSANNSMLQNSYQGNNTHMTINGNNSSMTPWQEECPEQKEHWVTVFGFPPSAANTVLARFSNCGAILDKQYPTQGNWAHIRYATRAEKERALALSGRPVLPGIMVGVIECRESPRITSPNASVTSPTRVMSAARPLCPTAIPTAPVPQKSTDLVSKAIDYVFGW